MDDGKEEEGDEQEVAPVKHLKQKSGILAESQVYTAQYRIELSPIQAELYCLILIFWGEAAMVHYSLLMPQDVVHWWSLRLDRHN